MVSSYSDSVKISWEYLSSIKYSYQIKISKLNVDQNHFKHNLKWIYLMEP